MRVLPCQAVPGVEIHGYAPQFNAKNFSHVFHDRSTYTVPGKRERKGIQGRSHELYSCLIKGEGNFASARMRERKN